MAGVAVQRALRRGVRPIQCPGRAMPAAPASAVRPRPRARAAGPPRALRPCKLTDVLNHDPATLSRQLAELRQAHRDLDTAIATLQASIASDELTIKRLKKRKLLLKDSIARLESALIPDEPA